MYPNSKLYYLNQMGITPWVIKEKGNKSSPSINNLKLIVLNAKNLSDKARALFNGIINYLNLNEQQFSNVEDEAHFAALIPQIQHGQPFAILNFDSKFSCLQQSDWPVFSSLNLETLIQTPVYKKKLFVELNLLKNHFLKIESH